MNIGAAAGIRTRVVGLEGQWTLKGNVLDQARLRPHNLWYSGLSFHRRFRLAVTEFPEGRVGGSGATRAVYACGLDVR